MRSFLLSPLGPHDLGRLLKSNLVVCLICFLLLEIWRPYFFLTDDNFSVGFPMLTEIGRSLKSGQSPFICHYLFGGNYDLTRDASFFFWHPFLLGPSLLADTPARFCIMDADAFLLLLTTVIGFSLLAFRLVREFNPELPAWYVVFFTFSFLFSSYILTIASSWLNFLGNQSALPWLGLGIFERRLLRGTLIILVASVHQLFIGFLPMVFSTGLCFTVFAGGISWLRRDPAPFCSWVFGSFLAILITSPVFVLALDGFSLSMRGGGLLLHYASEHSFPATLYPFSFFFGNWTDWVAAWGGNSYVHSREFPYLSVLLACAASWCLLPILGAPSRWRGMEMLCLGLMAGLVVLTIRPVFITEIMLRLPLLKSIRWPFREALQLLFFFHILLLIWRQGSFAPWWPRLALFSSIVFLLPLPFSRIPTLNDLTHDRQELFSGRADRFWDFVKTQLSPGDEIATVMDHEMFRENITRVPLTLLGTANFPCYFRVRCASGYSPTVNTSVLPLKMVVAFNFGAYSPAQVPEMLRQQPSLKIIFLKSMDPLEITLLSQSGSIDLTPQIPR